ncbi:MAG TPA: aminotransferase class III-fold pyridoxal phosphate-dependent enzyme, partial [Candidatus Eisenbacteria bacterium]|nr:aminotransferase class III-fold pyridoxal phosphate-dependent enzyme [Candidatus Eisenbacteria bacterium]
PGGDLDAFVRAQREALGEEPLRRARRVAAVLVEPIQGEGGVHFTSAGFMRRLRVLTRIYDVPLLFDEVQTGWGATGRLWAHEMFDLPAPPDAVIWAKKAQNGVLFVSEELATFFQEEKKFNTTWEGDSVGMVRLLAVLDRLDLDQVARTGEHARAGLEAFARDYAGLIHGVRGAGVMLGFDVVRGDWRDALRERAFRLGLVLLPAGERTLRFYPRYDTEPYVIDEAVGLLRRAIEDLIRGRNEPAVAAGPEIRVGTLECPIEAIEAVELTPARFAELESQIVAVEAERYGDASQYPPDVLRAGRRPLLQFPSAVLAGTLSNPGALGLALRDRVSGRVVAYALGSALEGHDEEGVSADPRLGENDTFYLHALATLPSIKNQVEVENLLLTRIRDQALAGSFSHLSTLIEERVHRTGPEWLRNAQVLQVVDDYLRSGIRFVYLHTEIDGAGAPVVVERRRTRR